MNATLLALRTARLPATPAWLLAWAESERGRFMPWLAVFMGAGVLSYFSLRHEPALATGPALVAGAAALCLLLRGQQGVRAAALAGLFAAAGFASAQWASHRVPPLLKLPRTAAIFTGTVAAVEQFPDSRRVTLAGAQLDGGPALSRTLHLKLRANDPVLLAPGDSIRARAVLRPPAPPAYPGAWDLQRDAYFSGLGGAGAALGPVTLLAHAPTSSAADWLRGLREGVAARLMAGLPGPEGAIAATVLTGLGTAIPAEDRAAFRDSGLAHLLAVAGLHIGIVMGLVMGATRLGLALWERAALRWPCKQIAAVAALAAGAGYVLLTGMHVPVLRSFGMAALVTLGIATGRRALSMRGLALAAITLMLLWPEEVVGVSFQMSFAAVLALIAGYEAMRPALGQLYRRPLLHHLATLLLTSLLAGAASAPFAAFHFGRVQLYFILGNMVAVPLFAAAVMPAGLLALALMPLGLERLTLVPMGWALDAVLWVAWAVSALPAAVMAVPHIPPLGLGLVGLGLAWLGLWRSGGRLLGVPVMVAGLFAAWVSPPADLLVSADARLIALRSPATVQAQRGFSKFERDAWSQYWAEPLTTPFPASDAAQPIDCGIDGCRIAQGGVSVLLARSMHPMDCVGAALVVSAEPARDVCPTLPRIDRFTVWRDGAHAVWLRNGAAIVVSDRAARGERPWVPPPPIPAARRTSLPLAQQDSGGGS